MNNEQWFTSLVEDLKDIATESSFASRWSLVEGYHQLGSRILQDEVKIVQGGSSLRNTLHDIAKLVNKRERSLYYAVEFVRKFPDLNMLPEGKNVNWFRICNKYLTETKKTEGECEHIPIVICKSCKKNLSELYEIKSRGVLCQD